MKRVSGVDSGGRLFSNSIGVERGARSQASPHYPLSLYIFNIHYFKSVLKTGVEIHRDEGEFSKICKPFIKTSANV